MIFLLNYIKLFLWSSIYYFQNDKSEIIEDIIVKNIKDCGCIAIKFSQWILPKVESIYEIDYENGEHTWFKKLETLYDNCNEHPIEYTKQLYSNEFNTNIEKDYEIIKLIASGSIGQVYKVKSKIDNQYYALKCLHPDLNKHILFFNIIIWMLYNTPIVNRYIKYYLPIKLNDFIKDFKTQTDLINEGNNCLKFYDYYRENDKVIIPTVSRVSSNILIMSYEDGIKHDDKQISNYNRNKIFILMKLFIKNNEHILNFTHGDLHKGNWCVRLEDNKGNKDIKIVIYDFGFCWYIPESLIDHLIGIDNTFFKANDETIDDFAYYSHILINRVCSKEKILIEMKNIKEETDLSYDDPIFLFKLIINTMRNNSLLIDSYVIQSLIVHNQLCKDIKKYDYTLNGTGHSGRHIEGQVREFYQKRILDIKNYCDTYNIFQEYLPLLTEEHKLNKEEFSSNEINYMDGFNYEEIKKLALS